MCISDWSSDVCSSDLLAVQRHGALAPGLGLLHRFENAARLGYFRFRRRVDGIGERNLRRMDRPFAFAAADGGAVGLGGVAFIVGEIDERAVDRAQSVGARSEERRVGQECVSTGRSRWALYTSKNNTTRV